MGPDLDAPGHAARTRCPSCAAAVRPDAPWCTQCYADLRAPAPASAPVEPEAPPAEPVHSAALPLLSPAAPADPAAAALATWPCSVCGAANAIELDACASCGAGFLSALRAEEPPVLVLPVVGDLGAMSRAQRLGLATAVVLALLLLVALVGLVLG